MTPKLSRKQDALFTALLTQSTIEEAAKQAGVSESTARRWLKEEAFAAEYRAARRTVFEHAQTKLQQIALEAVQTLQRNLAPEMPPAVQVRAATTILEHAKAASLEEILERLERLEAIIAERDEATHHPARRWA